MKKEKIIATAMAFALLPLLTTACSSEDMQETDRPEIRIQERKAISLNPSTRAVADDIEDFYMTFTKDVMNYVDVQGKTGNHNVVVSPLSATILLGMMANGVDGDVHKDITDYLHTDDINSLNELCRVLLTELPCADEATSVRFANSFWVNSAKGISLNPLFSNRIRDTYEAGDFLRDFAAGNSVKEEINKWCSENTNGMIKNYLSELPAEMLAIAINATAFNGPWAGDIFSQSKTVDSYFNGLTGRSKVKMMVSDEMAAAYGKDENFEYFALPYGNSAYELKICLPRESLSVEAASEILSAKTLESLKAKATNHRLTVRMPKMNVDGNYDLSEMFSFIGMGALNNLPSSSIFEPATPASVSYRQQATLELDEDGTKAAAISSASMIYGASGNSDTNTLSVTVDRPFFFFIQEYSTGACIISGRITDL